MTPDNGDKSTSYIPTAEEIAAACLRIQQSWTPAERDSRRRATPPIHVTDPSAVRMIAQESIEIKLEKRRAGINSGNLAL
jgi:hypothetical protein